MREVTRKIKPPTQAKFHSLVRAPAPRPGRASPCERSCTETASARTAMPTRAVPGRRRPVPGSRRPVPRRRRRVPTSLRLVPACRRLVPACSGSMSTSTCSRSMGCSHGTKPWGDRCFIRRRGFAKRDIARVALAVRRKVEELLGQRGLTLTNGEEPSAWDRLCAAAIEGGSRSGPSVGGARNALERSLCCSPLGKACYAPRRRGTTSMPMFGWKRRIGMA
jgi:hypothetical protein